MSPRTKWATIACLASPPRAPAGPRTRRIDDPLRTRTLAAVCLLPALAGSGGGVRAQAPDAPSGSEPIAVLAFTNLSPDPEDAWLGEGIAETLTAELEARGLTVVGRLTLAGAADDPAGDLGRLHRRLGARRAVTGSYQQIGQRLRVDARIVDLPSAVVLHAVRVDGERHEIFALQDRIAGELATGLSTGRFRTGMLQPGRPPAAGRRRADTPPPGPRGEPPLPFSAPPSTRRPTAEAAATPGAAAGRGPAATVPVPSAITERERAETAAVGSAIVGREREETAPAPGAGAGRDALEDAPTAAMARRNPAPAGGGVPSRASGGAAVPAPAGGVAGLGIASGAGILTGRPSVRPGRTAAAPRIDGTLDDLVWERATRIADFVQQRPLDGAPATEDTEVLIAYDNDNLYFGIRAHYSDPALIRANRADRDQTFIDDTVAVYFDPFLDQQRAYVFSVNGYGVQADSLLESSAERMPGGGGGGGGGGRPGGGGGRTPGSGRGGMSAALAASLGAPPPATCRGTPSSTRRRGWPPTAGRRRWPFRSRASAIPNAVRASRTDGGSRSCGRSSARTRPTCGPRSRAGWPAS